MKLLVALLLLIPATAAAESQTVATDGGILEVRMEYDAFRPATESALQIEFINPQTGEIQEHIDYTLHIYQNVSLFGPTPLIHSSEGVVSALRPTFPDAGIYTLDVTVEGILFNPIKPQVASLSIRVDEDPPPGGGCLIATAAYGSELAPQVQRLREIRAQVLATDAGRSFMDWFNHIYYAVSPTIADIERESALARHVTASALQPLLISMQVMEAADSEYDVILYGSAVIFFNLLIYVAVPVAGVCLLVRSVGLRIRQYGRHRSEP